MKCWEWQNTREQPNYIPQTIGRDSGRPLLHFKQTVLNVRGSSQSKKKWLRRLVIMGRSPSWLNQFWLAPAGQLGQCEIISACASVDVSSWLGKRSFHINTRLSLLGCEVELLSRENLSPYKLTGPNLGMTLVPSRTQPINIDRALGAYAPFSF